MHKPSFGVPPERQAYLLAILAALQWGTTGVLGKTLFSYDLPPLTVVALRAVLVFLTLAAVVPILVRQGQLRIQPRDWLFFAAYGLVGISSTFFLFFTAIDLVGITVATVLLYSYPAFVTLLSSLMLKERITGTKAAALVLTLLGVALVSGIAHPGSEHHAWPGMAIAVLTSVVAATYTVFGKKAVQKYPSWTVLFYSYGFGAVFLAIAQVGVFGIPDVDKPLRFWVVLIALAWVATIGAGWTYVSALKRIEASRASIVATLEPAVAALLAYLFFGEKLTVIQLAGAALVVAGVGVVQWKPARQPVGTQATGP